MASGDIMDDTNTLMSAASDYMDDMDDIDINLAVAAVDAATAEYEESDEFEESHIVVSNPIRELNQRTIVVVNHIPFTCEYVGFNNGERFVSVSYEKEANDSPSAYISIASRVFSYNQVEGIHVSRIECSVTLPIDNYQNTTCLFNVNNNV